MKTFKKVLSILLVATMLVLSLAACGKGEEESTSSSSTTAIQVVDYVSELKLDMSSSSAKAEVKDIKTFVDGDTTHFYVDESVAEYGVLKARYLAINTPESTGKIEPYGKKASDFTKSKLKDAVSIILESDDENWNKDSTGGRHMVWVWYKTTATDEYRNLNLEILQNGLALPSNAGNNRYGETCSAALAQARALKLFVFSGEKDPDYYDGPAVPLTLKELRTNIEAYNNTTVTFEGNVAMNTGDNGVYVESYDEETGLYFGMHVYYGFGFKGEGLEILKVGNHVRIVGDVQYYEAGGTYQVTNLYYSIFDTEGKNVELLGTGHPAAFPTVNPADFANNKYNIELEDSVEEFDYAYLTLNSSIAFENLKVVRAHTTTNPASSSKGAITLYCEYNGVEIIVRTVPLFNEQGELITQDAYVGKTINVKGFVEYYLPEGETVGQYQIKVLLPSQITVLD